MDWTFTLYLISFCCLNLAYQVEESEEPFYFYPGELLKKLDDITSEGETPYEPVYSLQANKAEQSIPRIDNENSASEYDYDKAYEEFVTKYFSKGEEDLRSTDEDNDDVDEEADSLDDGATPYENEPSTLESSESRTKRKSTKSKKCKRIRISDQSCIVCEDPKTNEKSKTCSFSTDSKPERYETSKERSSKRSSDDDNGSDEENLEANRSLKGERVLKDRRAKTQKAKVDPPVSTKQKTNVKCVKKIENSLVCIYCGTKDKVTRTCTTQKKNPQGDTKNSKNKTRTTKKIYKRMITYTYNNKPELDISKNAFEE